MGHPDLIHPDKIQHEQDTPAMETKTWKLAQGYMENEDRDRKRERERGKRGKRGKREREKRERELATIWGLTHPRTSIGLEKNGCSLT